MISKRQYLVFGRLFYECLLLNFCVLFVLFIRTPDLLNSFSDIGFRENLFTLLAVFNVSWLMIILADGNLENHIMGSFQERSRQVVRNGFIFIGIMATLTILLKVEYFNRSSLLLPIFLFTICNIVLLKPLFEFMKRRTRYASTHYNVLLVGNGKVAHKIFDYTKQHSHLGYEMVGVIGDDTESLANRIGGLNDLGNILDSQEIDEIFISLPQQREEEIKTAIKTADLRGVRVNLVPETPLYVGQNYRSYALDSSMPVYQLRKSPLDKFRNYLLKKAFDMVFAASVMILLSPILLLIAILIKLDGRGPILYAPIRKGEAGTTFRCLKFRTMSECDDPKNGTRSTIKNDPRITKIGKFLRKYDLDELPQFINVLRGEMSVIGPRPHRVNLQNDFRQIVDEYMIRHYIKPGLSGWAQVNGWRGPTETVRQKTERINHDLWYIENWSFWLDIKIVFRTVFGRKARQNAF
ncbi:MAG: undecaprenyl-phosphate glucose phosphotransferase [Saprospiraceae bacterium]|nr:undecaprenyl-phosphate glucose phosphotransferase [Saprospiraceae bacterium]